MAIEWETVERGPNARDAFWWLALQELRGLMRVGSVQMTFEDRRSRGFLQDIGDLRVRCPEAQFSVRGEVLDMIEPLPSADESIAQIQRLLSPLTWAAATPPPPLPPSPPAATPKPRPTESPMDDTSTRFLMMELD